MSNVKITRQLDESAKELGRQEATFRTLYRIDPDENGVKQMGNIHQYPPIGISRPGAGRRMDTTEADKQLANEQAEYPGSDFFQVEVTI